MLTLNEEPNIRRCLASVAWADQVVVVDSGSADGTVPLARSLGAEVVEQSWLGFSAQREFALRLPLIRHDWVYFVDADEWVSPQLAAEIADRLAAPDCAAFAHRLRLVFHGHLDPALRLVPRFLGGPAASTGVTPSTTGAWWASGRAWTGGSGGWPTTSWTRTARAWQPGCTSTCVTRNCECERRRHGRPPAGNGYGRCGTGRKTPGRSPAAFSRRWSSPRSRPSPPRLFCYMYIARLGFLDGLAGLRFCFYHAWYELVVASLQAEARMPGTGA